MTIGMSKDAAITNAIGVIEEFRKLDPEMQLQTALIFLLVARNEGCSSRDLMSLTSLSSAAVSRNIAALSKVHRKGYPGHNVVVTKEDPNDRRLRQIFITPRGRTFLNAIADRFQRG